MQNAERDTGRKRKEKGEKSKQEKKMGDSVYNRLLIDVGCTMYRGRKVHARFNTRARVTRGYNLFEEQNGENFTWDR